jgi:glycosyltransferase involved in cell wall biosynthesis
VKVLFLVNGDRESAMGDRATAFAGRLSARWTAVLAWRTGSRRTAYTAFMHALDETRPDVVYVMDMAVSGVLAAARWRASHRAATVVDTGDAITALARSAGRGPLGLAATWITEEAGLRVADHLVVRGTYHREWLAARGREATVVPDGVDLRAMAPADSSATRAALGLGDAFVMGILGSCTWNPRLGIAYGWDLVESLALLSDVPVKAMLIGDGSGVGHLKRRADELGVADRLVFAGRQPMHDLPSLLGACDVCVSTQTNDLVGNVRTTGKLPIYLACGRFVLASAVGEAARVLPSEMLLPYDGVLDREYPVRLAARIRELVPGRPLASPVSRRIAAEHFDYDILAPRIERVLEDVLHDDMASSLVTARHQ